MVVMVLIASSGLAQSPDTSTIEINDPVEQYLLQHGLDDLVVTYLEERLRQTLDEDQRIKLAKRLAVLYGRMLDESDSEAQRAYWAERSRNLLEQVKGADTVTLRLNIHKASYLRAERAAELYRLRAVSDTQRLEARAVMSETASRLNDLYRDLMRRIHSLEQRSLDDNSALAYQTAKRELNTLDSLASQAAYYAAWSYYYKAELSVPFGDPMDSLIKFGHILQAEREVPRLDELPITLLSFEHVARSVLGVALCETILGHPNTALDWLEALDDPETFSGVRRQLPAYRLWVLFIKEDWSAITREVQLIESESDGMSATVARLITVHSLEAMQRFDDVGPRQLAGRGIARLAGLGELGQILEISDMYDLNDLPRRDFILSYVLGLQDYEKARVEHGSDQPSDVVRVQKLYTDAQATLELATEQPDASQFPEPLQHSERLSAWCSYYSSRFIDAADRFIKLTDEVPASESEAIFWMVIVSLDKAKRQGEVDVSSRLDEMMRVYLERFPSSRRAGSVRFRLAVQEPGPPTLDRIDSLLQIPMDSDAYEPARREAEHMLYRLFRGASGMSKVEIGYRYLDVSLPLTMDDHRLLFSGSMSDADKARYLEQVRRVLDVLLTRGVSRLPEARTLLDRLRTGESAGLLDLSELKPELAYRRFQLRMLSGDFESAAEWSEALWTADPDDRFAQRSMRELFAYALQDWRAFPADPQVNRTIERVYEYGLRLIDHAGESADLEHDVDMLTVYSSVAEAAHALHQVAGEDEYEQIAKRLYTQLIEIRPKNHLFLKANAEIAEQEGEAEQALEYWRLNLAGLPTDSSDWFEAQYHVIRLLVDVDPSRASAIMYQHELLHPTYGPEPWGARLEQLSKRMKSDGLMNESSPPTGGDG